MQVPKRRAQTLKTADEPLGNQVTAEGLARWKRELERLQDQHPRAAEDVHRLAQLGDFSENAEYQDAKARLRRLNDRIASLKDRIMRAVVVGGDQDSGTVGIGSTVIVRSEGRERSLTLVGPREADPLRGKISSVSPLGKALIGHAAGETVAVETPDGTRAYEIKRIQAG